MSAVDVPATGSGGGSIVSELKFFPNSAHHDIIAGGERWLKSGLMETDPAKFDAYLWRWTIGTYWQPISNFLSYRVVDVASNGAGVVIAVLGSGNYSRSTDGGKTFSGTNLFPNGGKEIMAIEWIDALELFIAVGAAGIILTSIDGQSFQSRSSGTSADLQTIKWTGELLVIAGASKTIVTSLNGTSFAPRVVNIISNPDRFNQIAHFNGKILAVADSRTNGSAISEDNGETWSLVTIDAEMTAAVHGCIHDGEKFVAIYGGSRVATSVNGRDWTVTVLSVQLHYTGSFLLFDSGQYWASGASGRIVKSEDLKVWRSFKIDPLTASPGSGTKVKRDVEHYWAMGNSGGLFRGNGAPYAGWPYDITAYGAEAEANGYLAFTRIS